MSDTNRHTVCIIGGGMSGLFTGALLAKNGYKVTILEKNHIIGGGLQTFRRGDVEFDTGMQTFAAYLPNMISLQLCKYLGFAESLKVLATDPDKQEIIWMDKNTCYHLPKGRKAYQSYLMQLFPEENEGIRELLDCVFRIGHTYDYLFLQPIQRYEENVLYAYMTASEMIRKYIKNDKLVALFEYIGWTSGQSLQVMSALEFCMMLMLYIIGSYRFIGGSKQIVKSLCNIILNNNGKVLNDIEVSKVDILNDKIVSVYDKMGVKYESECYVWACSPKILLDICNAQIFRRSMTQRISEYTNPFTGFFVFCELKKNTFKFINSAVYISQPSDNMIYPQYIAFFTPSTRESAQWADTMEISIPCSYDKLEKWQETYIEHRGRDYEEYKQMKAEQAIDAISKYYPEIKNAIANMYIASGLTIRDYYGNPQGAVYGQQGLYIPIKTKIRNLFMTGQAVQNQGLAGTATTSVLTSEMILGRTLIEEIAKV